MTAPAQRRALLIGTEIYQSEAFTPLHSTRADTAAFAHVLRHRSIGAFDNVEIVSDPTASGMRRVIADFLDGLEPDHLGLLYVSGHGVRRSDTTGEFFFVATDTDPADISGSGVAASYVNEQLELCRAAQKVAILDCCQSGGFALGFRTQDTKSAATAASGRSQAPLTSRGVYVLSSSDADEYSYAGAMTADGPRPSVFTGELVEALRTGRGDKDSDGVITVEDLFGYVSDQLASPDRDPATRQNPVMSALKVRGRVTLARSYVGPPLELPAAPAQPLVSTTTPSGGKGAPPALVAGEDPWRALLHYYLRCVDEATVTLPLLDTTDADDRFVCLRGRERLLSGDLDRDITMPLPAEAAELVARATEGGGELWYGYPAVVLLGSPSGGSYRVPRMAPLFIRPVDVVAGADGPRLRPRGEPRPHPELLATLLGATEAQRFADTYRPTWQAGMHGRMVKDITHVLREDLSRGDWGIDVVELLRPAELAEEIDVRTPASGARNAGVLFLADRPNTAVSGLCKDLRYIADHTDAIRGTALGALLDGAADRVVGPADWQPVTPFTLNDAQREVVDAAMTRRLTVATGPPGTGKSQLVANLVATAVANGQKVLVASTNNRAVDEVWERCERLVPGAVIRTGSRGTPDYREAEHHSLRQLMTRASGGGSTTPATTTATVTARAELLQADRRAREVLESVGARASAEKRLLDTGLRRTDLLPDLHCSPEVFRTLPGGPDALAGVTRRARRVAGARWFGRRRRARFLARYGWQGDPTPRGCEVLAEFAEVERRWQEQRAALELLPADESLVDALGRCEKDVRARSEHLLDVSVRAAARAGHSAIGELLQAGTKGGWTQIRQVLRHVRGWAVTSLSVRRFPTTPAVFDLVIVDEASQCAIAHALPLLYRARRALVIGDPMQLAPVITLPPAEEAEIRRELGIPAGWLEDLRATHHRYSAFHMCARATGSSLLLDQHYRCHPGIAEVSNRLFYGGALTVLTDVRAQRNLAGRPALAWVDVRGTARPGRRGSWVNHEEADRVDHTVRYLLEHLPPDATVGVVTPFSAQQEVLRQRWDGDERVRVGTAHRFQGGERDAIVFSLVATEGIRAGTVAWLTSQLNLWNVAITRARAHLVVVGDTRWWRDHGGVGGALVAHAESHGEDPSDNGVPDPLLLRLYERLSAIPGAECQLFVPLDGYRADATVTRDGETTAVLLDRGCDEHPSRHLRTQLERCRLLGNPDTARRSVRVAAWQLFDSDHTLATHWPPARSTPAPL